MAEEYRYPDLQAARRVTRPDPSQPLKPKE
jgi:hypothetical protein